MADYIIKMVQNSVEAESGLITVDIIEESNILSICIGDNVKGMDQGTLKKAKDPFFSEEKKHLNRKAGLGIPFLIQMVESVQGEFDIKSDPEMGTSIFFRINLNHVDCPLFTDLVNTFLSIMIFDKKYDLAIYRKKDENSYRVSRSELIEMLGILNDTTALNLAKKFFISQESSLINREE